MRTPRAFLLTALTSVTALAAAPAAAPAAPNETELVSRATGSTGAPANATARNASISSDGRYVAFEAEATNLIPHDTDYSWDVFVRDVVADTTTLVSRANGTSGGPEGEGTEASISADGRYVAFTSFASLSPDDNSGFYDSDVYVRDLVANTTTLVSRPDGTAGAAGGGYDPSISADGRYVAFSGGYNLAPGIPFLNGEVYVRDLVANTTTLVSVPYGTVVDALRRSRAAAISADGRYVAFTSSARNVSADDTDAVDDVFVRDLVAKTTSLVSRETGAAGAGGNGASYGASISADGRRIAFGSTSTNLSPDHPVGDPDLSHLYVRDLDAHTTTLVSRATGPAGAPAEYGGGAGTISADGRVAAFSTSAELDPDEPPYDDLIADVFARDLVAGTTTLASRAGGAAGAAGSGDSYRAVVSGDGGSVAFESEADNLSPDDPDEDIDVFVRRLGPDDGHDPGDPQSQGGTQGPGVGQGPGSPKPAAGAPRPPQLPVSPLAPQAARAMPALRRSLASIGAELQRQGIRRILRKGSVGFVFAAPSAGTLRATAVRAGRSTTVLSGTRAFTRAGSGKVTLKVTRHGRRALRHARRATLVVTLAFTDRAGRRLAQGRRITLKP